MSDLISTIEKAFSERNKPSELVGSKELTSDELEAICAISKFTWTETTSDFWERNFDVLSWLSPEAFCYYLPGVLKCSIEDHAISLIAVYSVISMLDRTPNPAWWDNFFLRRWPLLSTPECSAVQEWLFWLSGQENSRFDDDCIERAIQTIQLLIEKQNG